MVLFVGIGKYHDPERKPTYQFTPMVPSSSSKALQGSSQHNTNLHRIGMHTIISIHTCTPYYVLPCVQRHCMRKTG